jgi:hypothetical protein
LPDKYHWEHFLRDLSSYIAKNFDQINSQQVCCHSSVPFLFLEFHAYTRERNLSKDANPPAPMAMPKKHPAPPIKGSSL